MKPKSMLLLVIAGGCGLVAAFAVTQHLAGNQMAPPPAEAKKRVVVAASDQEIGTQLKKEMLAVVEMASANVPEGAFADPAELTGQTLRLPIFKGEPVLSAKLGGEKTLFGWMQRIPPGMKVSQISVKDDGGLRGLISIGSHVDVLWLPSRTDVGGTAVTTLVQDVEVMAVGQRFDAIESEISKSHGSSGESYTLLVTDEQNQRLAAASKRGDLRITLRSKNDKSVKPIDEEALDILLGLKRGEQPPTVAAPAATNEPDQHQVTYIKSGETITETYNVREPKGSKSQN